MLELTGDLTLSRSHSDVPVDAGVAQPAFPRATTSLDGVRAKASYRLKDNLSLVGSYGYERYHAQDWRYDGVQPASSSRTIASTSSRSPRDTASSAGDLPAPKSAARRHACRAARCGSARFA
jgi:hypothetical protein